ncbi:hypothetical protein BDW59DRAFT_72870 [Aspergillus cavernicola]|uniref:YAG7-like dimerisation domain-containing protein n=1 Tax=Aspergillus cavernicola TaxID=176166 RepID=A0ABR4ICK4_9EURO
MAAAPLDTAPAQSPSPSEAKLNSVPNSVAASAAVSSEPIDFPHYKELQRNLRNTLKKLNASAKVDIIIAENPDKSLDELVDEKKINADQKAQALKKPALQATLAQVEEQLAHYKEFAIFYEQRLTSQTAELEKAHREIASLREEAATAPPEVKKDDFSQQLLSLSKFLCAAATMRRSGNETSPEARAYEGVLYQVYGGSLDAVASMLKLIDGADEKVPSVDGDLLEVTYSKVKQLSEDTSTEEPASEVVPASDPTTANAAYTELQDPTYIAEVTGTNEPADNIAPPPQTQVSDGANAIAEATWESHTDPLASSTNTDGFVEIPRDPAETETGLQATPANINADVQSDESAQLGKPPGEDFKSISHHQKQPSRGRGRGGRGRGGDGARGRGRGDFRGRSRGRGGRGRGRGGPNGAPAVTPAPQ